MRRTRLLRRQVVTAVALAAAVTVVGCTQQKATPDPGVYPGDAPPTPARTLPGLTATKPPSASQWPSEAQLADQAPALAEPKVIAPGYRVDDFLTGLAGRWDVSLGKQRLIDAPGDSNVWHFTGSAAGGGEQQLSIAGVPTKQGDIIGFSCLVDADRSKSEAFLKDCAKTGIPNWDNERAVAWLSTAKQQVDAVYSKERRPVVSSMFLSEKAHALLRRSGPTSDSTGTYELSVTGGGVAENS
ncbi:hypothetical protein OG230_03325 [Streptomyces sp. NBC_00234]|uniref:hypothetical protein n=1 Tax=Streptomyces sp. NBC_00234 TaxID=2903638 RepID=UPI002E2C1A51|nr:hypothetical protein [Streptomyces sp. NBC_00234]